MNISIGTDCEEISRFIKEIDNRGFLERIFTQNELDYCLSKAKPAQHLAVRFAGKEAIIKALSDQDIQVGMADIEILRDQRGVPEARVISQPNLLIKISLSHCDNIAVATALVIME